MEFLPKADPQRPLEMAIRLTRILGALFTLLGLLATGRAIYRATQPPPWYQTPGTWAETLLFGFVLALVPVGIGLVHMVLSALLARRQSWAVIITIVVASAQCLIGAVAFVLLFGIAVANAAPAPIHLFVLGTVVVLLIRLIYYLFRSFALINDDLTRGFEPIMPQPVRPVSESPKELPRCGPR